MSDQSNQTAGEADETFITDALGEADESEESGESEDSGGSVEVINGHAVGFAFLVHFREHPEIGLPVAEQVGDDQEFERAILHWTGSDVQVTWREQGLSGTLGQSHAVGQTEASAPASPQRPWWKFW